MDTNLYNLTHMIVVEIGLPIVTLSFIGLVTWVAGRRLIEMRLLVAKLRRRMEGTPP